LGALGRWKHRDRNEEALEAGEQEGAKTELIHLVDFNLNPCNGCRTCYETKNCAIEDDVEKIFKKVAEADGIIVAVLYTSIL